MKHVIRYTIYFTGLFLITIGINMSIASGLGVSPVSAFILPLSKVIQVDLGTVTTSTYILFVLIQMGLLKKRFKLKNLLQVPFSILFGFFITWTGSLMMDVSNQSYLIRLVVLLCSLVICAVGATLYIAMDVVPNPPEGLLLAICERYALPFSKVKVCSDCLFVTIGFIMILLCIHNNSMIREGTVIAALCTGQLIGSFSKMSSDKLKQIAFYHPVKSVLSI